MLTRVGVIVPDCGIGCAVGAIVALWLALPVLAPATTKDVVAVFVFPEASVVEATTLCDPSASWVVGV